jgi:hypothetical protein
MFYVAPMVVNAREPMMHFVTLLLPLHKILASMWDENNYTHFVQPHSTRVNIMFTKYGIHTLADIVIANSTQVYFLH